MRGEMEEIMKVIMNADDFGFSKGVNHGILEGFQHGIITSTSLMVNMPGFNNAVELMQQYPDLLKVGLHLVTSVEYAITPNLKTLTDENNHFYHDAKLIHDCDLEELKIEYEAQLQKFLATGFKPTHIDFHWCHEPVQLEAAMYLAKKYDLPIRAGDKKIEALFTENNIRYAPNHISDFYNQKERTTEVETMLGLLQSSLDQKLEIIGNLIFLFKSIFRHFSISSVDKIFLSYASMKMPSVPIYSTDILFATLRSLCSSISSKSACFSS